MTPPSMTIAFTRCGSCRAMYLPTSGPCPRCGAHAESVEPCPALGVVLAATELSAPPEGFPSPHRLALVELSESARLLAVVDGPLPVPGDAVEVLPEGDHFVARGRPYPAAEGTRGGGISGDRDPPIAL